MLISIRYISRRKAAYLHGLVSFSEYILSELRTHVLAGGQRCCAEKTHNFLTGKHTKGRKGATQINKDLLLPPLNAPPKPAKNLEFPATNFFVSSSTQSLFRSGFNPLYFQKYYTWTSELILL